MMGIKPATLALILCLAMVLAACSPSTKAPERFPGFESAKPDSLCTIRESEYAYIREIGGWGVGLKFDITGFGQRYNQYQVPAAVQEIQVYYQSPNYYSGQDFILPVKLAAGKKYTLRSHAIEPFFSRGNWQPAVIDDATGQKVSGPPIPEQVKEEMEERTPQAVSGPIQRRDYIKGPTYDQIRIRRNKIEVEFDEQGAPLTTDDGKPPRGLTIAGKDRIFHPAQALIISHDSLDVWSEKVPKPVAVRLATESNLVDTRGAPAQSFHSDKWADATYAPE